MGNKCLQNNIVCAYLFDWNVIESILAKPEAKYASSFYSV